jgi:hypothetical protein
MTHAAPTTTSLGPAGSTSPTAAPVTQTTVAVPSTAPGPVPAPGPARPAWPGRSSPGRSWPPWMARRRSREEERARIRHTFAAAFEAYTAYKEFPHAIRRRRGDDPEAERIRLSETLRAVQEKLSYYLAWTQAESAEVGQQYEKLVAEARRVAGRAMHDAWNDPPRATDSEMNIPRGHRPAPARGRRGPVHAGGAGPSGQPDPMVGSIAGSPAASRRGWDQHWPRPASPTAGPGGRPGRRRRRAAARRWW